MLKKIDVFLTKSLPYLLIIATIGSSISIVIYCIFGKFYLAGQIFGNICALWGCLFGCLWIGCKHDMSGVTEKQVNSYGIISIVLMLIAFLIMFSY